MADLRDAIAELRRATPEGGWTAAKIKAEHPDPMVLAGYVAATLNAVLSGDLIPRADAEAAQALVVERAAEAVRELWGRCEALEDEAHNKLAKSESLTDHEQGFWRGQKLAAKSIRRSTEMPTAPADALAAVQRLREERDAALDRIAELEAALSGGVLSKVDSRNILEALAAAEARADKLAAELAEARSWLTSCVAMIQHAIGEGYDVFIEPDTKRTLSQASTLAKGDQP